MNHLASLLLDIWSPGVISQAFPTPFVAEDYHHDRFSFKEYGQKQYGLSSVDDLLKLKTENPDTFDKVVQTWLYVGLLHETFGSRLDIQDFRESADHGQYVLDSTKIRQYWAEWTRTEPTQREADAARLSSSLKFAVPLVDRLDERVLKHVLSRSQLILCCIKILIETLQNMVEQDYKGESKGPAASVFLIDYLLDRQWCPCRVERMREQLSSTSLILLTAVDPHDFIGGSHSACTASACDFDSLSNYSHTHAAECIDSSNCPLVAISHDSLGAIYDSRFYHDIPVIKCTKYDNPDELEVQVVPSRKAARYYAISHVWSDGLGNPDGNALYRCHLLDVIHQAKRAYFDTDDNEPVYIWLDTLCIPRCPTIQSPKVRQWKKKGIERIDWTFASASAVIVRDLHLRKVNLRYTKEDVDIDGNPPTLLLALRFHCMRWATRCWTLGEAAVARNLLVAFRDGTVGTHYILTHISEPSSPLQSYWNDHFGRRRDFPSIVRNSVVRNLTKPFRVDDTPAGMSQYLVRTWNELRRRAASNADDVFAILAMANAISAKDVANLDKTERMKGILNSFQKLPASLLFAPGARVTNKDWSRWVPERVTPECHMAGDELLTTYYHGKLIGPLRKNRFPMYSFQGIAHEHFFAVVGDGADQQLLEVRLQSHRPDQYHKDGRWCLVLSKAISNQGFTPTASCWAFLAANPSRDARTERLHARGGQPLTGKARARWETLAGVKVVDEAALDQTGHCNVLPRLRAEVEYLESIQDFYVECDMNLWPSPIKLMHLERLTREKLTFDISGKPLIALFVKYLRYPGAMLTVFTSVTFAIVTCHLTTAVFDFKRLEEQDEWMSPFLISRLLCRHRRAARLDRGSRDVDNSTDIPIGPLPRDKLKYLINYAIGVLMMAHSVHLAVLLTIANTNEAAYATMAVCILIAIVMMASSIRPVLYRSKRAIPAIIVFNMVLDCTKELKFIVSHKCWIAFMNAEDDTTDLWLWATASAMLILTDMNRTVVSPMETYEPDIKEGLRKNHATVYSIFDDLGDQALGGSKNLFAVIFRRLVLGPIAFVYGELKELRELKEERK